MNYVIRFEKGKRIVSIPCENPKDEENKVVQAEAWAGDNPDKKVIVSDDGRAHIKLVGGKIKTMTQAEIDADKPTPPRDLAKEIDDLTKRVKELEK